MQNYLYDMCCYLFDAMLANIPILNNISKTVNNCKKNYKLGYCTNLHCFIIDYLTTPKCKNV